MKLRVATADLYLVCLLIYIYIFFFFSRTNVQVSFPKNVPHNIQGLNRRERDKVGSAVVLRKAWQLILHPIRWQRWLSWLSDWLKCVEKLGSGIGIVKGKAKVKKKCHLQNKRISEH